MANPQSATTICNVARASTWWLSAKSEDGEAAPRSVGIIETREG